MEGYLKQLKQLALTPIIPWSNSAMLLATPILSPATETPSSVAIRQSSYILSYFSRPKYVGPSSKTALMFGAAQALSGWIIYEGDLESGCGFLAAWSTLYLIVGGRGSLKALRFGRVWPLALTAMGCANSVLYGGLFLSGQFQ